jgi:two-component system NtrC family sensor kinase
MSRRGRTSAGVRWNPRSDRTNEIAGPSTGVNSIDGKIERMMEARNRSTVRLLRWMLVSAVLVPAALFAYLAISTYRTSFTLADERIERSLDVVSEQMAKVFQSLTVTFTGVEAIIRGRSDEEIRNAEELHRHLKKMAAALSAVNEIWIIDRDGHPLGSSFNWPPRTSLDLSDRDYFRAQRDGDAGTYIGKILIPRVANLPFFSVSRKRVAADGSFAGVIMISVRPSDFHEFYERLASLKGSSFAMIRDDGVVLARYPGPVTLDVKLDASSGFMQSIARNPNGGFYTTVSQVDGSYNRFAVRKLEGLPLYVSSGLRVDAIRKEWFDFLTSHLFFGLPATALLVTLAWMTLMRTRDLHQEAARRAAAEETLRQSQKMEAIGQLTGGIAHDFNNLLTVIIGNLDIALRKCTDAALERPLRNALFGGQRAAQLTQKLLAFSRRQPLSPRPVDANRLIAGMSDLLRRSLGEKIDIETVGSAGLWRIEVDAAELEAAMLNLAINARDAMPDGGKLTIETTNALLDEDYARRLDGVKAGQYVLISVTDSGTGMTPDVMERAFEPFFTTKTEGQGTGLGLSQVYGFVRQSGGHLKIYSEEGHGSTVKIYLPRRVPDNADNETPTQPRTNGGAGEAILVVEDDEAVRFYTGEILDELGYRVLVAPDAKAALRFIEQPERHIDLLLTDMVMPGLNGRQLADAARAMRPGLPVLFMTGYSRNAIVHQGRLDPGLSLIQKPFGRDALAEKVREVLDASTKDALAAVAES